MAEDNKKEKNKYFDIGKVNPLNITEEMEESYLHYAMSVIVSRALPDVRDGLKPVHRRILYTMHEDGVRHNAKFRKSATVVGSTMGRYHPHGDSAVYDALVRMAQDFSMRYKLVEGHGNFGSVDGDPAAAARYTECRMSKMGEEMLKDIEKDTVDFRPNYDGTKKEPAVLPSPLPQILLNGSLGIAVGMATSIPPHNAGEVIEACIHLMDNPELTSEDLTQFIKGPDFPTGGQIYGKKDIIAAYSQGKGSIVIRGRAEIEEKKRGDFRIIITEIPYQVQKSAFVQEIARLVENKKIKGIKTVRDESDRQGMRVVIDIKREGFPKKILNSLYKYTNLQRNFNLNMLALDGDIQPKVMPLSEILSLYLKHKKQVVVRRTKFELEKAQKRAHILQGLIKAINNIDEVIKTIKKSNSREDARKNLMGKFNLSGDQANAILEMKLQNLAKLEREKLEKELENLKKEIERLNLILKSEKRQKEVIKKELEEQKEKFPSKRKTKVFSGTVNSIKEEELIPADETIIMLTKGGYIKRLKPSVYKTQKRGGSGISGLEVAEEDIVEIFLAANTLDKLLFFTDPGKVYQLPAWEIPEMSRFSKGRGLMNFLEISLGEKVLNIIPYTKKEEEAGSRFMVMATKNGIIKKTALSNFKNVRKSGLIAIKLGKSDLLRSAGIISPGDEAMLITQKGKSVRFKAGDIRAMGRTAAGVRGIKLGESDAVVGMGFLPPGEKNATILTITEKGYGKKTAVSQYRLQKRGGSGIKAANISEKTGDIVYAKLLFGDPAKDLIIISQKGQVIRTPLKAISKMGRVTAGVKTMRLRSGDKVASAICL